MCPKVELELPIVLDHAAFMDSWLARGLCIAFVVSARPLADCALVPKESPPGGGH